MVVVVCVWIGDSSSHCSTAELHSAVCGDVYATNTHTHTQEHYDLVWRRRRKSSKTEYQTLNRQSRIGKIESLRQSCTSELNGSSSSSISKANEPLLK